MQRIPVRGDDPTGRRKGDEIMREVTKGVDERPPLKDVGKFLGSASVGESVFDVSALEIVAQKRPRRPRRRASGAAQGTEVGEACPLAGDGGTAVCQWRGGKVIRIGRLLPRVQLVQAANGHALAGICLGHRRHG